MRSDIDKKIWKYESITAEDSIRTYLKILEII